MSTGGPFSIPREGGVQKSYMNGHSEIMMLFFGGKGGWEGKNWILLRVHSRGVAHMSRRKSMDGDRKRMLPL